MPAKSHISSILSRNCCICYDSTEPLTGMNWSLTESTKHTGGDHLARRLGANENSKMNKPDTHTCLAVPFKTGPFHLPEFNPLTIDP